MTRRQHNNPNNIIKVNSVLTPFVLPIFFGEFCEKIIRFEFKPSAQTFPFQGSIVRYGGPLPSFKKKKKMKKKDKKKKNLQMNNFFKENIDIYKFYFLFVIKTTTTTINHPAILVTKFLCQRRGPRLQVWYKYLFSHCIGRKFYLRNGLLTF